MANPARYDDFGEKIGGARKDLWSGRGLYADDLDRMNPREAQQYVKKDNIWKKPDYQAMVEGGIPFDVVYFIKKVRDSLDTAPRYYRADDIPEKQLARQRQYVSTVREIQSAMEGVKSRDDVLRAYANALITNGYVERIDGSISGSHYIATDKGRENPAITNKLARTLHVQSISFFEYNFTRKAKQEQFGVPKESKLPTGYEIHFNDGQSTYSQNDDWRSNTFYVTKGHQILKTNLDSKEAAQDWIKSLTPQRSGGKKRFIPEQLSHIRREGPDYRGGQDATGRDYLDTFGFRGGEFGNWMGQEDRRASLNMGFDALKDLAAVLEISDRDISYQGDLAIAFGARGGGKAVAHYEPLLRVINLTKMRGAGSLAHEWWHGLDDYLGAKLGVKGLLSERPSAYPLMKKLIDTIKFKPETPEQTAQRGQRQEARYQQDAEGWLKALVLPSVQRSGNSDALAQYEILKTAFLAGVPDTVKKLSALKKTVSGHVIPKSERATLESYSHILQSTAVKTEPVTGRVMTDYYRNSKRMGKVCEKDGGYWESNTELTARAFATYILDKLPGRSDYLAGHAESAVDFDTDAKGELTILKAYPEGEERAAINAMFDELVADLKLQHYLAHTERPQTVQVTRQDIPLEAAPNGQFSLYAGDGSPAETKKPKARNGPER